MLEFGTLLMSMLILPLVAALCCTTIKHANLRDVVSLLVGTYLALEVLEVLYLFLTTSDVQQLTLTALTVMPGIDLAFHVEPLGIIFALIVSFLWIITTLYAIGYMRSNHEGHQSRFFTFFALSIFAALGIAFAANLFTLFVFYEVLTLCTYPLVTHSGTPEAKRGGRVYLSVLLGTSLLCFLPAIIFTYTETGTLTFVEGGVMNGMTSPWVTGALLALFVYGIGKAALMPVHKWLPAAMVAPTPVSALLHAVAVVKAGVFSIVKIVIYIFGIDHLQSMLQMEYWSVGWLTYIAGFTVVCASFVALKQDNLKRRLAYSTVSQLSYVIMAVSMFSPMAMVAAAFHIAAHAFSKITLFFAAGSIYTASGKKYVSELSGIGRVMPWTMVAFAVGALSMIGLPPTVGFVSKWYIMTSAFEIQHWFVVAVLIVSTGLNASYFLPIIYRAFFEKPTQELSHTEAPKPIVVALLVTAGMTLVLFFVPGIFMHLAQQLIQ